MKRGILLFVLLFIVPFVNAVPTFNLFDGNVYCGADVQTGYSVYANAHNGADSFNETGGVSTAGEYFLIVGADNTYNVSFYVEGVLIQTIPYNESLININNDLVLADDHALCDSEPDDDPGNPDSPGNPSGDDPADAGSVNDTIVNDTEESSGDVWSQTVDGISINITEHTGEVIGFGGDYDLVIDNNSYAFSIYAVNSENVKIWIDDSEYVVSNGLNRELSVGNSIVLATYLDFKNDFAKLSFQSAGTRATAANAGVIPIFYLIFGSIIFLVGIFFLIRKLSANGPPSKKPSLKKDDSGDEGLLAGPKK